MILVSGAEFFSDQFAINVHMDSSVAIDVDKAIKEHQQLIKAYKEAGIKVVKVDPPNDCQDGIYTANWALIRGKRALLSRLPNKRKNEEDYARQVLTNLGFETIDMPSHIHAFSGQGDAIYCGGILFCQSPYRTSKEAHPYIKHYLGYQKILSLRTKPSRYFKFGPTKINKITKWPDSPTYDIDLAIAAIKPEIDNSSPIIAYCPSVFKWSSRKKLKKLTAFDKIKVSKKEALESFALNLVSTGETVILNAGSPGLRAELIKRGLNVIELELPELKKGGGSIRCCSLTLDN